MRYAGFWRANLAGSMRTLLIALPRFAIVLIASVILMSVSKTSAQMSSERLVQQLPPQPKITEAEIDAAMAQRLYRVSEIGMYSGRVDPGKPDFPLVALTLGGNWAISVFPVFGNCDISVLYRLDRNQPFVQADTSLGFASINVEAPPQGADVAIQVIANTAGLGCPYHVKTYKRI